MKSDISAIGYLKSGAILNFSLAEPAQCKNGHGYVPLSAGGGGGTWL